MKIAKRIATVVAAAAFAGGCASGGGGSGATATYSDGSTRELTLQEFLACLLTLGLVCPRSANESTGASGASAVASSAPAAAQPVPFTRWRDHRGVSTKAESRDLVLNYDVIAGDKISVRPGEPAVGSSIATIRTTSSGQIAYWNNQVTTVIAESQPSLPGRPGLVSAHGPAMYGRQSLFLDFSDPGIPADYQGGRQAAVIGVIANPYELGWDYQSFGIWSSALSGREAIGASNFGAQTPASAVPLSGAATFTGKLAGYYVSPSGQGSIASADVSISADFGARSLGFASTGTTLTRNLASADPAAHLNLAGTLTYAPGSASFSGTLANAGATMSGASNGQFYGPAAQELGGAFALKSPSTAEAFAGAYGAKR